MRLVIIGYGYAAQVIHAALAGRLESLTVTCRTQAKAAQLKAQGLQALVFDGSAHSAPLDATLSQATHLLVSAPPGERGDPLLARHEIARAHALGWVGYLSTVGVYGDRDGGWVDEASVPEPVSPRSRARLSAEQAWLHRQAVLGFNVAIFRLAGIYGPGRSPFDRLRAGTAERIVKPGQVFNRIHVDDIARVVVGAATAGTGGIFNVCDDEPAPPQDVIAHAAGLLGLPVPPDIPFRQAELSPMALSFYSENKRVSNARIRQVFGAMTYPTYRDGLAALLG